VCFALRDKSRTLQGFEVNKIRTATGAWAQFRSENVEKISYDLSQDRALFDFLLRAKS
jgi:hypothetical protein